MNPYSQSINVVNNTHWFHTLIISFNSCTSVYTQLANNDNLVELIN